MDLIAHVLSSSSTHASFLTNQTGSKCGPTLQISSVVLAFFASGPLRLPCGPTPGPLQAPSPIASLQSLAFSLTQEDRRQFRLRRIHPPSGLSQLYPFGQNARGCTVSFMLRPAVLASTPGWVRPAPILRTGRLGTLSGQVQPVCHHTNPPPAYTSKRATDVTTSFQVARYRSRDLALCKLLPKNGDILPTLMELIYTVEVARPISSVLKGGCHISCPFGCVGREAGSCGDTRAELALTKCRGGPS